MNNKCELVFKPNYACLGKKSMFKNVLNPPLQFRVLANLSITHGQALPSQTFKRSRTLLKLGILNDNTTQKHWDKF